MIQFDEYFAGVWTVPINIRPDLFSSFGCKPEKQPYTNFPASAALALEAGGNATAADNYEECNKI